MKKLNKYERKIMTNLYVITFICGVGIALNIVLPLLEKPKLSLYLISQLAAIGGIYVFGWISSRTTQMVPITITFYVRGFQALIFIFWLKDISWTSFFVMLFVDILLLVLLVLDGIAYKYTIVKAEDDEFYDG